MALGIGIDTGGTYTDAVIYDFAKKEVIAKTKTRTTKENLEIGIGKALDALPSELLEKARLLSLSTTLATNACVENKGGRGKLVLIGTSQKNLDWLDAKSMYGLKNEDVFCIENKTSFDGKVVNHPDWNAVMQEQKKWFAEAQALAVSEVHAVHNSAVCEKLAKENLTKKHDVPLVMGVEVADELNFIERGATALLNAKLLPVMDEFIIAVKQALKKRKLEIKQMVVRSDGSLMSEKMVVHYPVQTILSGPAASVIGARGLEHSKNNLIVDMGGTTTDISIVENGKPAMTRGIRIGGVRTQIKGVYIDTFGLGGDSRITVAQGRPVLHTRRVQPLCVVAMDYPEIKTELQTLLDSKRTSKFALYEFLYFVKEPNTYEHYTAKELELIKKLRTKPLMLGSGELSLYELGSERLESEGVIMRAGLTPTDIMHVKGDFNKFDKEASILAIKFCLKFLPEYETIEESIEHFCDAVYDSVCEKLYCNIVRIMLLHKYPEICAKELDTQVLNLIKTNWNKQNTNVFFDVNFNTDATLVGIGAPIHIFLPRVAKALNTNCVIPENAEVANALGAIIADIHSSAKIDIKPIYSEGGIDGYTVYTNDENPLFEEQLDALEFAKEFAKKLATQKARDHGALGELQVEAVINNFEGQSIKGNVIDLGTQVIATATGRV